MKAGDAMRAPLIPAAHWKPYPELVADVGGAYEVIDSRGLPGAVSSGMTNKVDRLIYVPLEEVGRSISQHELLHVALSPERIDCEELGVDMMVAWAVEDARVNMCAAYRGWPVVHAQRLVDEVVERGARMLRDGELSVFVLHAMAGSGTNVETDLDAVLAAVGGNERWARRAAALIAGGRRRLDRARAACGAEVAPFSETVKVARWLARQLGRNGFGPVPSAAALGCCASAGRRGRRGGRGLFGRLHDGVMPGRMRIATPPLPLKCAEAKRGRARRKHAASEGSQLYRIERFATDQCVFARRSRRSIAAGVTMLIDTSGSMSLSATDLDHLVAKAPAGAVVAIYSGSSTVGELRIVARDGRRAATSDLEPFGSGNVVDFPALQWLAKQPGPRAWISDGRVTGNGDLHTEVLEARCKEICEQARIARLANVKGAMKWLEKEGVLEPGRS